MKILAILLLIATPALAQHEGYGVTPGGTGGRVIAVTSLADSGPGTLRAALEAAGPRTVVFRVAGTIALARRLDIRDGRLTVAGQTAPAGGITIRGDGNAQMLRIFAEDVILQYLTIRAGTFGGPGQGQVNVMVAEGAKRVVLDHLSTSWSLDENIAIFRNIPDGEDEATWPTIEDITVQHSIMAEGLIPHSTGLQVGGENDPGVPGYLGVRRLSIHRNLFAHNSHRNPGVGSGPVRIINNVVYNWASYAGSSWRDTQQDWIGNSYQAGPSSGTDVNIHEDDGRPPGSLYAEGNVFPRGGDQRNLWIMEEQGNQSLPDEYWRDSPLPSSPWPVTITSAEDARTWVLANAGNSRRLECDGSWATNRDPVDVRIVADVVNGTGGGPPNHENDVGGYPVIVGGQPCPDSDGDGIFDAYAAATPGATLEMFLSGGATQAPNPGIFVAQVGDRIQVEWTVDCANLCDRPAGDAGVRVLVDDVVLETVPPQQTTYTLEGFISPGTYQIGLESFNCATCPTGEQPARMVPDMLAQIEVATPPAPSPPSGVSLEVVP